jgi:Replication-relaxation
MNSRATNPPTHRPTDRLNATTPLHAQTLDNDHRHFVTVGGRAGRLRQRLSGRDISILLSLRQLRLMTGAHVRRLYFPDGNPITQARKARATLKRLAELQLIVRLRRRVGGIHAGSEGHVVGLSGLGQAVLDVGADVRRRHRSVSETKLAYQEHVLTVTELYTQLIERTRMLADCELLAFAAEPQCWRRFAGVGGQRSTLKPDAFVRLAVEDFEVSAFIEVDMATESLPTIVRKLGVYGGYWRSGQEQHDYGVFPAVWWLVPDIARLKAIVRAIKRIPQTAQQVFKVVTIDEAATLLTQLPETGGV